MAPNLFKIGLGVASASFLYLSSKEPVQCESKREFYTSNTTATVPGLPKEEEPQLPKLVQKENSAESFLESNIKEARVQLIKYLELSKQTYIEQSDKYFDAERKVTDTLTSLHDKREVLFPNTLYVFTGFLAGLVLTRRSNLLLRAAAPVTCGLIAFRIFLPSTFDKSFSFVSKVEQEKLPDVYAKQTEFINRTEELVKQTSTMAAENTSLVERYLTCARRTFGEYTGLNVDQTVTEKKK